MTLSGSLLLYFERVSISGRFGFRGIHGIEEVSKTGDTAELMLWGGLVLLGIAGLVFVMRQYHSEKRKKK